jgi:hypothetical protein
MMCIQHKSCLFSVSLQISIQELLDDFNDMLMNIIPLEAISNLIFYFPAINNNSKVETYTCEMGAKLAPPTKSGNNNEQNCS